MGNKSRYKYKPKTYRLRFEDEEMAGLVVEASSPTIGGLLAIVEMAGEVEELSGQDGVELEMLRAAARLFGEFAGFLQSWNLDGPGGKPVPCTADGLLSLDLDFGMAIVHAWMEAVSSVPPPLPGSSSSAPPSGLEIPMNTLSASPGS